MVFIHYYVADVYDNFNYGEMNQSSYRFHKYFFSKKNRYFLYKMLNMLPIPQIVTHIKIRLTYGQCLKSHLVIL